MILPQGSFLGSPDKSGARDLRRTRKSLSSRSGYCLRHRRYCLSCLGSCPVRMFGSSPWLDTFGVLLAALVRRLQDFLGFIASHVGLEVGQFVCCLGNRGLEVGEECFGCSSSMSIRSSREMGRAVDDNSRDGCLVVRGSIILGIAVRSFRSLIQDSCQ
jgi:hypothetical protein